MSTINDLKAVGIGIASPEEILSWSHGEVESAETINHRTLKPEPGGLFCERIFGPTRDWECACGKYRRAIRRNLVCERCGVEVTRARVRRERFGHITLASPVAHILFVRGIPSVVSLITGIPQRDLEKVIYYNGYLVIDPGETELEKGKVLTEQEYIKALARYGRTFRAAMGGEALRDYLASLDLASMAAELRAQIPTLSGQNQKRPSQRLEIIEALLETGARPEWMVLTVLPVIPPDCRPMVQLDGGRFATTDLNDLYRRVINRNNRLKRMLEQGAPDLIIRNERRMLQEAVDSLLANGKMRKPVKNPQGRDLKSFVDIIRGKQGRFRLNLLGKRVDYSGRSVIVIGPELKLHQCGLPRQMAVELFKPMILRRLIEGGYAPNMKIAKKMVDAVHDHPIVWSMLDEVIKERPVLLNRAPTLHRLSIQAFEPVLIDGKAIQLHPLVCQAFNADFDGDQMAVHVPLSPEAVREARELMMATRNMLNPKDGSSVIVPHQDIILGMYYLTIEREGDRGEGKVFASPAEAIRAYEAGAVSLHARILVRMVLDGQQHLVLTTAGKLHILDVLPDDFLLRAPAALRDGLGVLVPDPAAAQDLLRQPARPPFGTKKKLGELVTFCYYAYGERCAEISDGIKDLGFGWATRAGVTISIADIVVPESKPRLIAEAEAQIRVLQDLYGRGLMTDGERYERVLEIWRRTDDQITADLEKAMPVDNPVKMMIGSGARGNIKQAKQLAGMRGLMADTKGRPIEQAVTSNFLEGLSQWEYFVSSHGARKGGADTALRTADAGYLTRRLVDVAQDCIINADDCGTDRYVEVTALSDGGIPWLPLADRIAGRVAGRDIVSPAGEILVRQGELITPNAARDIVDSGITRVPIRTVVTCELPVGVCRKCYGVSLANGRLVDLGEAVGVIAAQSIGEPGTQLTMRTFHTGGVAGDDITQGLPRVEELFEARKPKREAVLSGVSGQVEVRVDGDRRQVAVISPEGVETVYPIPYHYNLKVRMGDHVTEGDPLTDGAINPGDLLRHKGEIACAAYLIQEVQRVYRMQGVHISDKHIEVIVRQMFRNVRVTDPGDTGFIAGSLVDRGELETTNRRIAAAGGRPAEYRHVVMGVTKSSSNSRSWLSAASFQETSRVLTDAAVRGKKDYLIGLKENVIIGRLIPAGTGFAARLQGSEDAAAAAGSAPPAEGAAPEAGASEAGA